MRTLAEKDGDAARPARQRRHYLWRSIDHGLIGPEPSFTSVRRFPPAQLRECWVKTLTACPPASWQDLASAPLRRKQCARRLSNQIVVASNNAKGDYPLPDPLVTVSPDWLGGEPCFTGRRVPVKALFDLLKADHSSMNFWRLIRACRARMQSP